jgi:trans-aconitate methyltransferase
MSDTTAISGGQRTSEWMTLDERALSYHLSQWDSPKRSTVHFHEFVRHALPDTRLLLDLGCGGGAATAYLAERAPRISVLGIDISTELVATANALAARKGIGNLKFGTGDLFDLAERRDVDGVVSMQTLSWLPEVEGPLREVFTKLAPGWVALSSLFYEGDISCRIEVNEHARSRKTFYNVYSLPAVARLCTAHAYRLAHFQRFEIDVDIPKPTDLDYMSTHTVQIESAGQERTRLQISGPLLMNWYFVMIEKAKDTSPLGLP